MSLLAIYSSPTTPGQAAWAEDVTPAIRLGSITGLSGEARLGATGIGNVVLDDPTATLGHSADGIVGLKQFHFNEMSAPAGNRRLWTGYVGPRSYRRGEGEDSSLRTGAARKIDVTLIDVNDFLSFRVFAPVEVDATSSFVRPAETDIQRIAALLAVDFISTTLFNVGYIPTVAGASLNAYDFTGMRPIDVLNACAQASGRNFWVKYHEATNQLVLWYDSPNTDGTATLVYDSTLSLSNVLSEKSSTVLLVDGDAVETIDPSRVISAGYLTYAPADGTGGTAYATKPTTAYTFAWRDAVMDSTVGVATAGAATTLLARYLLDNDTEDPSITCTVQIPTAQVTLIHEGMRIQAHFSHLSSVMAGMTWCRIMSRTIRVDVETQQYYWLDLVLSPITTAAVPIEQFTHNANNQSLAWWDWPEGVPGAGNLAISFVAARATPNVPNTTSVPASFPSDNISDPMIAGTEYTNIAAFDLSADGYPIAMAYRVTTADDTIFQHWINSNGIGRPHVYAIEIAGLASPSVTKTKLSVIAGSGSSYPGEPITAPTAGYIFFGCAIQHSGPRDIFGWTNPPSWNANAPAVELGDGWMQEEFGGYSLFGYRYVTAGTYTPVLTRTNPAENAWVGWIEVFCAGPVSPTFPAG